ncbi:NAD-binding protein [Salarchaeum japonicum]|uniref:NAD-binding protein n=1 Tax=Salarchaeum japonicum TaxID=555573 RepID=A0AAV3SYK2_9EURY|nr:NAD-binding protein [Salarchaeum japonicum]
MVVSRESLATGRIAVGLTMLVAVLSVVTGVVEISQPGHFGPVAPYLPESVKQAAGFTGALTGFLMVFSALGMRRGLRAAWYSTAVLLPFTAVQGVVQTSIYSTPLIALSLVSLPVVLLTKDRFDRSVSLSTTQLSAAIALTGIQIYGTVGAYALREHFPAIDTVLDAFWFTLVTSSTVGYGDITPTTQTGRLFGLSVLVLGTASFAIALGALLGPAIEARFANALGRMTQSQLEALDNHVIVAGYGDLTEPLIVELRENDTPFVVVTPDASVPDKLPEETVLVADPSDEAVLDRAGIDHARAVVAATNNDGEDALVVLTARQMNADVRIVAAATDKENEPKLRRAGADAVISPAVIGGHLLMRSAFGDENSERVAEELLEDD